MASYESWGRYPKAPPANVERLDTRLKAAERIRTAAASGHRLLAYGRGRSYGDSCLNGDHTILDSADLDRFLSFDAERGVLCAEAGVTLAEILSLVLPYGWFLPVTPGTKFVTLGGAVAHDVHGKNHHAVGCFGRFVTRMGLVRSTGETFELTPLGQNADLFAATLAGLGLTGFITHVEIQLLKIESDRIDQITSHFRSLAEFFELSAQANGHSPYVVAWLDTLRAEGRGVLMAGDHAPAEGRAALPAPAKVRTPRIALPVDAPSWLLRKLTVRAFNEIYFRLARPGTSRIGYEPFFYPLDVLGDWNRGYGRRGFFQYQFVVPFGDSQEAVADILARLAHAQAGSFLAVLKTFGDIPSLGMMSFPRPGVTLALDLPNRGQRTIDLLQTCDEVVRSVGGAVYPAKDACMRAESFRAFFPKWESFSTFVDPAFSSSFWRRVTCPG